MAVDPGLIFEAAPDAILVVSADGVIRAANAESERVFGYPRSELVGRQLEMLLPERLRGEHVALRTQFHPKPDVRRMGAGLDIVALRRDGAEFPADISLSPGSDGDVIVIVRDMSERRQLEQDLRDLAAVVESRAREFELQKRTLESVLDNMSDGVIVCDSNGALVLVNAAASRLLPRTARRDLPPAEWPREFGLFLPDQATPYPAGDLPLARLRRGEEVRGVEVFVRHKDRPEGVWVSVNGANLKDPEDRPRGGIIVLRDVSAEKFAESALLTGQESERKRISRELHDSISQTLSALILETEMIRYDLPAGESTVQKLLDSHSSRLKQLDEDISRISRQLHPIVLERFGLEAAIEQLCREINLRGELRIELSAEKVPRQMARGSELCLFRIAQEALRNVARHSGSREAEVRLIGNGVNVTLEIKDSGQGFDPDAVSDKARLGLLNMRERVRIAGGVLTIESEPGTGTLIQVQVPVERAAAQSS